VIDPDHPLNECVLRHLQHICGTDSPVLTAPEDHPDPYAGAGSHPDVVERLWSQLGRPLPGDGRVLVHGAPALVHPTAGVVLAIGFGTRYALRLPRPRLEDAIAAGCEATVTWSDGTSTDLRDTFGGDWLFGAWCDQETQWLAELSAELAQGA
jgi:hypothetical protein